MSKGIESKKKKWKHQNCTIVNKFIGDPPYVQTVMWCNNHQSTIVVKPV